MAEPLKGECKLLRIFCPSSTRWHGQSKVEAILESARKEGLAGATLFDGIEGFRENGAVLNNSTGLWHLARPRECIVEIIDEKDRLDRFVAKSKELLKGTVATLERACIPNLEEL